MADAPSMPAGSHEMRDYYSHQDPPRSSAHTAPSITPYLGLRARLSQVWFNRWTILLLLVLARTLIGISSVNSDLASARTEALSACSDVESMGSAMASLPHYMSQGVNEMAATGVDKAVNGLMDMLTLTVTGVEELTVFGFNMMTSTYLCLITFAVNGTFQTGAQLLQNANQNLTGLVTNLGNSVNSSVGTFESAYNSFISDLSKVSSVLGTSASPPTLDLSTQMTALKNLKLPASLDADIQSLSKNLDNLTFAQVQNDTDNLIRDPFEQVKTLINQNFGNYTFDRSLFPVPDKQELTFCSDNDGINQFFDELVDLVILAKKIFIAVIVSAAVLACIPMAYREIRRWRIMQSRAQIVGSGEHDPLDVVYIVSRPYTATAGIQIAPRFSDATRRQVLIRWVIAYATSEAALFVLALAVAGLFSAACQAILLKTLEKEIPDLTNQVGAFADKVIASLNNASESWSNGTNAALASTNNDINQQVLGWVNITTGALNNTLNTFINETTNVLHEFFDGTPLIGPVSDVFECLVGLKVAGIEKALTWVSDNAHIQLPSLPNNTFSLGAVASIAAGDTPSDSFLSSPGDQASDKISTVVARFTTALENTIRTEALVALAILGVWLFIVLIAVVRALFLWYGRDKPRGEGGVAPMDPPQNYPPPRPAPDFRSDNQERFVDGSLAAFHFPRPSTPAPQYTERKDPFLVAEEEQQPHLPDRKN